MLAIVHILRIFNFRPSARSEPFYVPSELSVLSSQNTNPQINLFERSSDCGVLVIDRARVICGMLLATYSTTTACIVRVDRVIHGPG